MICSFVLPERVEFLLTISHRVYPYLMLVSALFLIATLFVYIIQPEIRNNHNLSIMCYVASLAVTYIGLGIIKLNLRLYETRWLCVVIGKRKETKQKNK